MSDFDDLRYPTTSMPEVCCDNYNELYVSETGEPVYPDLCDCICHTVDDDEEDDAA